MWLEHANSPGTLVVVAVMDGPYKSYILTYVQQLLYLNAVKGRNRVVRSFSEVLLVKENY